MDVLDDLAAQHAELAALVGGLDDAGWSRPSRCAGWNVRDVLLHLAQTDEGALASLEGRFPPVTGSAEWVDVDDAAGRMVEADRGATGAEVLERWTTATALLRAAFATVDPSARVPWVVGLLSARTLAATRLSECWIHTGDIAHGLGVRVEPTDRLRHVARLAWRTLPYAFERAGRPAPGPVELRLTGPGGDEWVWGEGAPTVVTGTAEELCLVAGQRLAASEATTLRAEGPDARAVLELVRTFA
jgi:uncharacterized protein (TIGR03084 family)